MTSNKSDGIPQNQINPTLQRLIKSDPYLAPYKDIIGRRLLKIDETRQRLTQQYESLADFASGHEYFGLHFKDDQWVFREWAPNATAIFLIGDMTGWQENDAFALKALEDGIWEIRLAADTFNHGDLYRLRIHWPGGMGDRIPAYARRVVQDPESLIFNSQVWRPDSPYCWRCRNFQRPAEAPLIYEVHIGMAQQEGKIGSYQEFSANILPRVIAAGYNTLQIMAIPEHPYYGSFGYQVSSFFAASSRFGAPEDLKALIDEAHGAGLAVIIDLIHSHAVSNEVEGLSRFDGTLYQYFHDGPRAGATNCGIRAVLITASIRSFIFCFPTAATGSMNTTWTVFASTASPACSTGTTVLTKRLPLTTIILMPAWTRRPWPIWRLPMKSSMPCDRMR
jgi:1,4-alpha-glucan branching enzyme